MCENNNGVTNVVIHMVLEPFATPWPRKCTKYGSCSCYPALCLSTSASCQCLLAGVQTHWRGHCRQPRNKGAESPTVYNQNRGPMAAKLCPAAPAALTSDSRWAPHRNTLRIQQALIRSNKWAKHCSSAELALVLLSFSVQLCLVGCSALPRDKRFQVLFWVNYTLFYGSIWKFQCCCLNMGIRAVYPSSALTRRSGDMQFLHSIAAQGGSRMDASDKNHDLELPNLNYFWSMPSVLLFLGVLRETGRLRRFTEKQGVLVKSRRGHMHPTHFDKN